MRGVKREHCVICGRHTSECGALSARYKCERCRVGRVVENVYGIHNREGDAYERWRSGMIRFAQELQQVGR